MSLSLKSIGAITLFVGDLQRSKEFYQDIFGVSVVFEDQDSAVVGFDNTIINLLKVPAARELIEPAAVADGSEGARLQFTVWVDDADAVSAELRSRGIPLLNGPMDRPWGQRTASFRDPDGTIWEVAQHIGDTGES
jgi:catechol 2,3-dioxygenase-like lactoylglutathione lyase family enzyme